MHRGIAICIAATFLGACAAVNPVPADYKGPLATVRDSVHAYDESNADFFFVAQVDGQKIQESRSATLAANRGRGNQMEPKVLDRKIPARPTTLTITGRTTHAMPIAAMMGTEYQVEGDVKFTAQENHTYVVKGELGETYSAVWLEDSESGQLVGPKIEVHGSAALNMFQK